MEFAGVFPASKFTHFLGERSAFARMGNVAINGTLNDAGVPAEPAKIYTTVPRLLRFKSKGGIISPAAFHAVGGA
jgi:hypothetical protein